MVGTFTARAVFLLCAISSTAAAFELKRDSTGAPVSWHQAATWVMDPAAAQLLGDPQALEAAEAAVRTYAQADPAVSVALRAGPTTGVGYNLVGPNQSEIVVVQDDWPYDSFAIAVTVVTVDLRQHRILDADIALNARSRRFKALPAEANGGDFDDLQNTLTHELGHALGLAHNPTDQTATMFPAARRGEIHKRSLAEDDVAGLEALYPPDGGGDGAEEVPQAGCAAGPGGPLVLGVALAMAAALRRRSPRRASAIAAALALCALPAMARAQEMDRRERRVASAAVVMETEVASSRTRVESGGRFVTRLQLRAHACARGPCPDALQVDVPGGRIGDLEQWVDGKLPPAVGSEVGVAAEELPAGGAALRPRQASLYQLGEPGERAAFDRAIRSAGLRLQKIRAAARP